MNILKKIRNIFRPKDHGPIVFYVPENSNDLFMDVEYFQAWLNRPGTSKMSYGGLEINFGKSVFIFDVNSCTFKEAKK